MFKYVAGIVLFFVAWYYLGETWQVIAPFLFVIFIYHKIHKFVVGLKARFDLASAPNLATAQQQQHQQGQESNAKPAQQEVRRQPPPVQQIASTEESDEEFMARVRAMNQ